MTVPKDGHFRVGIEIDEEVFSKRSDRDHVGVLDHLFAAADASFRSQVRTDGKLRRIFETIEFSAEALFTSLMQIGLPPSVAIKLPFEIIPFLATSDPAEPNRVLTTADVRIAVVQALHSLETDGSFSRETVSMWSAAYVRRYGNPSNQFVKVIDNGTEVDLNYDYIRREVLPHLVNRILELPKSTDPFTKYGSVFSSTVLSGMAQEIIGAVNTLNLYSIRYKTLLNLLQDLVLEPPHPWIVSSQTISKVVDYNLERAAHHFARISAPSARGSTALLRQSAEESVRHSAAAILAHYGAFLGVGSRYGLLELRRMLTLRLSNAQLWSHCNFHNIELDLRAMGSGVDALAACVARIQSSFAVHSQDKNAEESWRVNANFLLQIAQELGGPKRGPNLNANRPRGLELVQVCLLIDSAFESFSEFEEQKLLDFLTDFLEYPGKIEVIGKEAGSTKIYVRLSRHQAEQLIWALKRGLLHGARITDVQLIEDTQTKPNGESSKTMYDVFLCHNSEEKAEVKRIGLWLRARGIVPWLDEWELRPGLPWQGELESTIENISCAAVFVGSSGFGPWQTHEAEAFLREFVSRKCPVIPVVLKTCNQPPKLPSFLGGMTWVDFRKRKPNPYHQLHFGIKGVRPSNTR